MGLPGLRGEAIVSKLSTWANHWPNCAQELESVNGGGLSELKCAIPKNAKKAAAAKIGDVRPDLN
jgi:hypothetical protein